MLSHHDRLAAIVWKSKQLGMTYGKYVSQSSENELNAVYREYEAMLRNKEELQVRKHDANR